MRRASRSHHPQLEAKTFRMALIQMIKPLIWLTASVVALVLVSGIGYHHMTSPAPLRWPTEQDAFVHAVMKDFSAQGSLADYRNELRDITQGLNNDPGALEFLEKRLQLVWNARRFDFQSLQYVNYTVLRDHEKAKGEVRITDGRVTLAVAAEPLFISDFTPSFVEGPAHFLAYQDAFVKALGTAQSAYDGSILYLDFGVNHQLLNLLLNAQIGASAVIVVEAHGSISIDNYHMEPQNPHPPIFLLRSHRYQTLLESFPNRNMTFTSSITISRPRLQTVNQGHFLGYFNGHYAPTDYVLVTNVNRTKYQLDEWIEEVAILLELARLFSEMVLRNQWRPHRTVIFSIILPLNVPPGYTATTFSAPYLSFLRSKVITEIQVEFRNQSNAVVPGTLHVSPSLFDMANYSLQHVSNIFETVGESHDLPLIDDVTPIGIDCFGSLLFLKYSMHRDVEAAGYVLAYHINFLTSNFLLPLNITRFAERLRSDFEYRIFSLLFARKEPPLLAALARLQGILDDFLDEASQFQTERISKVMITDKNVSLLGHWGIISLEVANRRLSNVHTILADSDMYCIREDMVQCGVTDSCFPRLLEITRTLNFNSLTTGQANKLVEKATEECRNVENAIRTVMYSLNL